MTYLVVFESLWGNTAAIARAIAEGLGADAVALSTAEATADRVAGASLVVAGAPVFAFHLSSDRMREEIRSHPEAGAPDPDLTHPSLQSWLASLPEGDAPCAAFDTQVRGPFGKGAPTIARALEAKGYRLIAPPEGFLVKGKLGPLRPGELERATQWGRHLAQLLA